MSLSHAYALEGDVLPSLPGEPPFPCAHLSPWQGRPFWMPPGDPRLEAMFRGGPAPSPPFQNLEGATRLWETRPDWMDFLDPKSPAHVYKLLERDLYLHHWKHHLPSTPGRALDLGGGIGRFTLWLLARGWSVDLVEPDLRSLWRAVSRAAGLPGRLDVHWSTGERLPEGPPVDLVLAVEVLCYVESPSSVLEAVWDRLAPGGVLLVSVEARHGWVSALDVPRGSLDAFFEDGVVDVPGDRWVRTSDREHFQEMLRDFELLDLLPTHYASGGPFEAAADPQDLSSLLRWESRCREHPLTRPWNRAWTAAVRRPEGS